MTKDEFRQLSVGDHIMEEELRDGGCYYPALEYEVRYMVANEAHIFPIGSKGGRILRETSPDLCCFNVLSD